MPPLTLPSRRAGLSTLLALLLAVAATTPAGAVIVLFTSGKTPTTLYAFDAPATAVVELKVIESAENVHSLAFCVERQRPDNLLGLGKTDGTLLEIELGTFDETVLGQLPPERAGHVVQMTCDRDGTLYLGDQTSEELLALDPATCTVNCDPVVVGRVETAPGAADVDLEGGDLEVDDEGNLYLITNQPGDNVFQLDKETALATPLGELDTGGRATGATWVGASIAVALSTDDLLHWADMVDGTGGTFGPFTLGGQLLDIGSGDVARPLTYDPVLTIETDAEAYEPGDTVAFDLFFRQFRFRPDQVPFTLWLSDADGDPVSRLVRVGPIEVPYLREVSASRSFVLPLGIIPGTYFLNAQADGYPDGPFLASAPLEVLIPE